MNEKPQLEDLVEAFLDRCRIGDAPDVRAFAKDHPEHADQLLELLPLMQQMEGLGAEKTLKVQSLPAALPDLSGSDYRLIRKIGSGGMGVVFEALQISLNRNVAVKFLLPSLVKDTVQREQFENEARIVAALHHPNIIKILSAECNGDCCFYAMDLIDGKGLDQCEVHDLRKLAGIGFQAARALAYAHRCKVMHRDVKPSNLLLDSEGVVHVGDFGLASTLQGDTAFLRETDTQSGTIRYMPPERLMDKICSFASDQYSFGATLYELISQSPLLLEKTPKELIRRICKGPVPPLRCAEPDLAAIVNKSVSFREEDRYPDMDALAEDLRRFLDHEPVAAARPSIWRRFRLWAIRKPAVAALGALSFFGALAFVIALTVGYARTAAALNLAERNADAADAALSKVFSHMERQIPSADKSALLAALMPYYQEISSQRDLTKAKRAEVSRLVGLCALRSGNCELAETAFRQLAELSGDPASLNFLSETLRKQGKQEEADIISRRLADRCSRSEDPDERAESVRALRMLSDDPESEEWRLAFDTVTELLRQDAGNPDYRFQYAVMLGRNPRLFRKDRIPSVEPNAVALLNDLTDAYPERPEYGLALMDLMNRNLQYARAFHQRDWDDLDRTARLSDRLLGRFPNTPDVVETVVRFRVGYITALRRKGDLTGGRKESERLMAALEILFYNPETPDSVKESLLQLQLDRLNQLSGNGRTDAARLAEEKIADELRLYHGPDKEKFQQQLWSQK